MSNLFALLHRAKSASYIGFLISFTGSIVPGVVTLGVLHALVNGGVWSGIQFSLGNLPVEAGIVWLTLIGMGWLQQRKRWFKILEWCSFGVVVALTVGAGYTLFCTVATDTVSTDTTAHLPPLLAGMLLRLSTPTLIPYWLGWNTVLLTNGIIRPERRFYLRYVAGVAMGTFTAHLLFMLLTSVAAGCFADIKVVCNWLIFIALLATSCYQIFRISQVSIKHSTVFLKK